jgi:P4 family phage/plasmid primase-like protien
MSTDTGSSTTMTEEYLRRTTADMEAVPAVGDDPGSIPSPRIDEAPEPVGDDDRSLARAFMAEENADGRRLRFSNRDVLWSYDAASGVWRRLSASDAVAFAGRLYDFVLARLRTEGEANRASSRYRSIRRILFETLHDYCVDPDGFDRNHDLIAFANGVYDLSRDRLLPHGPENMLTIGREYDHDPTATCPRFEQFLDEVLVSPVNPADDTSPLLPDPELRLLVQEMMGYCLATDCRAERGFFLVGEGRNGKSTLIRIVRQVVGEENACDFDVRDLGDPQMTLRLMGKLVAVQTELDAGKAIPDARFKAIVSGEGLTAKEVYKVPVSFKPFATFIMAGNDLPATRDRSKGMWARTIVIPFLSTFEGPAADANLQDRFVAELPGIFNFAIEGYRRLRDGGWRFTEAAAARRATVQYREESDSILLWFCDSLQPSETRTKVATASLYDDYVAHCNRLHLPAANGLAFGKRLKRIVEGREGRPWATRADDGTEFDMEFHRDAGCRGYVGHFALGDPK